MSELPHIDEHATTIAAGTAEVWRALTEVVELAFSGSGRALLARVLRCADATSSGPRPLDVGSTMPGFRVNAAVAGSELALAGRHRFSRYALVFRLEALGEDSTRLVAETRAEFPGVAGRAYRSLVIGTRGHVLVVRSTLAGVRRRSERLRARA